jgi:hypothetical protein
MTRYIDASPKQRFFQYERPAARKAVKENWAALERQEILNQVARLGERPAAPGIQQVRWDRRIEALRGQFREVTRRERRNRWIAGLAPMPAEVRAEFEAAGQAVPSWMER